MLAVVASEAHEYPLSPLFEVQKQAAAGLNNYVNHFYTQGYEVMGKGGRYSRYVSYQAFCTQVEVIGIRNEYSSSIHDMIKAWAPEDCPHVYLQACRAAMPLKQPPTYTYVYVGSPQEPMDTRDMKNGITVTMMLAMNK